VRRGYPVPVKTPIAARTLGLRYHQLIGLLRYGHIDPPGKDSSGDYVWTEADIERARQALAARQRRTAGADLVGTSQQTGGTHHAS
jgi:hypothetical protein